MKFEGNDAVWEHLVVSAIQGDKSSQATIDSAIAEDRLSTSMVRLIRQILRKHRYKWDWRYRERAKAASRAHYSRMGWSAKQRKIRRAIARRDPWGRWEETSKHSLVRAINRKFGRGTAAARAVLSLREWEADDRGINAIGIVCALEENYTRKGRRRA